MCVVVEGVGVGVVGVEFCYCFVWCVVDVFGGYYFGDFVFLGWCGFDVE